MDSVGLEEDIKTLIFETIAATAILGNVEVSGTRDDAEIANAAVLKTACDLLGVDATAMTKALLHKEIKIPGQPEPIMKKLSQEAAMSQVDAVAKMVYSRIFDYIVNLIDGALRRGGSTGSSPEG
jgi:myosin-5